MFHDIANEKKFDKFLQDIESNKAEIATISGIQDFESEEFEKTLKVFVMFYFEDQNYFGKKREKYSDFRKWLIYIFRD